MFFPSDSHPLELVGKPECDEERRPPDHQTDDVPQDRSSTVPPMSRGRVHGILERLSGQPTCGNARQPPERRPREHGAEEHVAEDWQPRAVAGLPPNTLTWMETMNTSVPAIWAAAIQRSSRRSRSSRASARCLRA